MGMSKIEEMEKKIQEEQARLKARLDARKSAPPSASLVAPEENKFYKT